MPKVSPLVYWSLQVPSLVLGALILVLLLHLVLAAVAGRDNTIARCIGAVTWPITASVGAITPRIIPPVGVIACSVVWLFAARTLLAMIAMGFGLRLWG